MRESSFRFRRFRDLDRTSVNVDLQVHTTQTDGRASIAEVLEAARLRGLAAIAFTEHVRRDTTWFPQFASAVREAAKAYPELLVLVGCEAKALDSNGSLDASDAIVAECDVVLGSVHRFPDGKGGLLNFADLNADACAEIECELALGLLRYAPIHVLAHPGGMTLRRHGAYPPSLFRKMLAASLERNVAVEINSSYLRDMPVFLSLCGEMNPYVSVGSDVHGLEEMGRCRDMLLKNLEMKS
jgi:putative hydrolase